MLVGLFSLKAESNSADRDMSRSDVLSSVVSGDVSGEALANTEVFTNTEDEAKETQETLEFIYDDGQELESDYESSVLDSVDDLDESSAVPKRIAVIYVVNNNRVPAQAILNRIPYRIGDVFDPLYTSKLIHNIYDLEYFSQVQLRVKELSKEAVALYIILEEDPVINEIKYTGNKHLKAEDIEKKLQISHLPAADEQKLARYARQIKKIYREKDYHNVNVEPIIERLEDDRANVTFAIEEGTTSLVKRVFFEGNKAISSRRLRGLNIFTREDWILRFLDRAGSYQPEAIEIDKRIIENFYQSNGYLTARVTDARVKEIGNTGYYEVTFVIDEGDFFTISQVSIPGHGLIPDAQLQWQTGLFPGMPYSKDAIREAMETLRTIWGQFGYINAEVIPYIEPDMDNNTVAITLDAELGNKIYLNRITITGNKKTCDKVIRRNLTLVEGGLLTVQNMDFSKNRVAALGYFDMREGVNWKVHSISDTLADLELMVKEVKTGKVFGQLGFNGSLYDIASASTALKVGGTIADTNILGTGISTFLALTIAADEKSVSFNLTDPWLFDRPLSGAIDAYYRQSRYDEIKNTTQPPNELLGGGSATLGFVTTRFMPDIRVLFQVGLESISFDRDFMANLNQENREFQNEFNIILRKRFESGQLAWVSNTLGQDFRNNPSHPTRGYQWSVISRFGLPAIDKKFAFYKFEADATWYTPLIGEYDLIFMMHGHLGLIEQFRNYTVPYRELFHIGGPSSVRGFVFGQIGPQLFGDSLGAKKCFWVNTELIFPVTKDFSVKAALFYDGGAGWDTLDARSITRGLLKNNRFHYRHAIGLSVRMTRPTPVRIDWGFKLDRRRDEKEFEVSMTALQEF